MLEEVLEFWGWTKVESLHRNSGDVPKLVEGVSSFRSAKSKELLFENKRPSDADFV